MIHQDPSATRTFDTDQDDRVVAIAGSPDKLAFFDPDQPNSYLAIKDPVDLAAYR